LLPEPQRERGAHCYVALTMEDHPASSKEGPTKTVKQNRRRKYYLEVQVPKTIKIRASVKYEESLRKKDPFREQSALETFVKSLGKKT
jgi:hypothetical protein